MESCVLHQSQPLGLNLIERDESTSRVFKRGQVNGSAAPEGLRSAADLHFRPARGQFCSAGRC